MIWLHSKWRQREIDPKASRPLCVYSIFPPTLYRLEFNDATVRDHFNLALKALRDLGLYEQLAKKYDLPLDQHRPYFKP